MKRAVIVLTALVALCVTLAGESVARAAAQHVLYVPAVQQGLREPATDLAIEAEVVRLINEQRAAAGLAPLAVSACLATAADAHSLDMATRGYFSHIGSDGSTAAERMNAAGYAWSRCGEVIGGGYQSPQAVVQGWMGSPDHRSIILDGSLVDVGVGYVCQPGSPYTHYWTADLAAP